LHRWHTDPLYLDGDGNPRVIPNDGAAPSFAELARTCSRDLPVGALRVELLRIGAIALVDPGNVRVLKRAAVPESVDDRLVTSLSFNLYCLASTIAFNSNPKRESMGRIERFVQSSSISDTMKASLRSGARLRIEQFTEELDLYFAKSRGDGLDDGGRIGVGVYYFEDD